MNKLGLVTFGNDEGSYIVTGGCDSLGGCLNLPLNEDAGCPANSFLDVSPYTCSLCDSNCKECTSSPTFCSACSYTEELNPTYVCVCKEIFTAENGNCLDVSTGQIVDKDTGLLKPCANSCGICVYDEGGDGPEICLDNFF
jgi:hypothetical protein